MDREQGSRVGIDLGGTKLLAAVVESDGRVLRKKEIPTEASQGADGVIARMIGLVEELAGPEAELRSIGVATAGTLDAERGVVLFAGNLGWRDVPLGEALQARFGCPVKVENDANAAAYGEWRAGAGRGTRDCVYVTVSTGIGAGLISGGRLITGTSHSAAEFGHLTLDWRGPKCSCGNVGCLELYASGTAIARRAAEAAASGAAEAQPLAALAGGDAAGLTARHVSAAAAGGDVFALRLLREAGEALGAGLAGIVHAANPELIVLGGGAIKIGEPLLAPMRETFAARCIPSMARHVRLATTELGGDAGVIGAALLAAEA
jgi:glucokinase